ncbi:MAG: DUF4199 domain-containing protein [Bacteroidales bacterium]|nr:DUF4199 domain-containing protein [Bacteroidales bacterium]MCL2133278.1 DUF4199 domain-containing protein [Bacteroidales bacterium]
MKSPLLRHAATYGLYVGLALIVMTLLDYLLGYYGQNRVFGLINYLIMIIGIVWATIQYRDNEKDGFISYGDSVGYGVLLSLFFAIITVVFSLIFVNFISPDYMEHVMNITRDKLYEAGRLTEDQIEMSITMMENMRWLSLILGVFLIVLIGLVISLIASIFIKRNKPMFHEG